MGIDPHVQLEGRHILRILTNHRLWLSTLLNSLYCVTVFWLIAAGIMTL